MTEVILLALAAVVIWFGRSIWRIQAISKGPRIDRAARAAKALVVVDMQPAFLGAKHYDPAKVTAVTASVLKRIRQEKAQGTTIIALQQEWRGLAVQTLMRLTAGGAGLPGRPETAILPEIATLADHVVVKHVQDGYERPALNDLLDRLGVGQVEVVGLDGAYCVQATARGAAARGYDVTVDAPLVLAADPRKWAAAQDRLRDAGVALNQR